MAKMPDMEKLDAALSFAGSQWRDEDLDEILALLGDEPQPPQPAQELPEETPEAKELPDEEELFDLNRWNESSQGEGKKARQTMALPDLRDLISMDDELQTPAGAAVIPELKLDEPEGQREERIPEIMEEFIPAEPHRAVTGEQPDFSDAPVKKQNPRILVLMGLLAAAELCALVFILIWWRQWIL